jgi:hypothetical protein
MLQTPIRLRNLATQAEDMLQQHGLSALDAYRLLRPLRELPVRAAFLKAVSEGLAIYVDDLGMQAFRLPYSFREQVVVGNRFHVTPLLPLLVGEGKFFLLAVSANSVRMFVGDRWSIEELSVPGLPISLREALNQDQPQSVRQVHTANFGGGSRMLPSFHGQGGREDVAKDDLLEFFHIVDRALRKFLADEQAPLVSPEWSTSSPFSRRPAATSVWPLIPLRETRTRGTISSCTTQPGQLSVPFLRSSE